MYASTPCAQLIVPLLEANSACTDSAIMVLQVPLAVAPAQQPAGNSSLPPGISCQGSGSDQVCASRAVRLDVPERRPLALCQTIHTLCTVHAAVLCSAHVRQQPCAGSMLLSCSCPAATYWGTALQVCGVSVTYCCTPPPGQEVPSTMPVPGPAPAPGPAVAALPHLPVLAPIATAQPASTSPAPEPPR